MFSKKRLGNIIKTKRLPQYQAHENHTKESLTSNFSETLEKGGYRSKQHVYVSAGERICNRSVIPLRIRGFNGPLNYKQLHELMSNNVFPNSKMDKELQIYSYAANNDFVYYICDERKILDSFTNRRFFRLNCDSQLLEPGASITEWPQCYKPTHCVGKPAAR